MQWLKIVSSSKCKWGSLSPFESMQWLKTLSSSTCKWEHCLLLKACNDWRHCHLRNVDEGHCRLLKACNDRRHCRLRNVDEGHCRLLKACNDWRHCRLRNVNGQITIICLYMPSDLIVFGWRKRCGWPCLVSACHRTWLSLDGEKGVDDHVWSLRAIKLDCLWMAKGRLQQPRSKDIESSTKGADDHICLCMSSNLIVSGWWRGD